LRSPSGTRSRTNASRASFVSVNTCTTSASFVELDVDASAMS
jgi:hypothetical protein